MHALLGPHPNVWTLFAFTYATLLFATCACVLLGISQSVAHERAWGLWGIPMAAAVVVGMYTASQVGQRLAGDQAHQLQDFLLAALSR